MNNIDFKLIPILTMNSDNASCTLIEIDGINMLFDCGWNEIFSLDIARKYDESIKSKIHYIFLCSNSLNKIGALPYLWKNVYCKEAKIYATTPIAKLGLNILIDGYVGILENKERFDLFSDLDISSSFVSINEIKFKENIKITKGEWEIELTPLPSGESLGSCVWKLQYKLKTIVYAPIFSIKTKYICDPFAYENLKNVNLFITESKMSTQISLLQNVIEKEFKKNLLDELEKGRNIFIPSDTANLSLEILLILEKILEEFSITKKNQYEKYNYRIVVCSYTSQEVVESLKSLMIFYGTAYSQQFCTFNENSLNLQNVKCIKDIKEYYEVKKNHHVILISSFPSLDTGLSYKLIPEIISDNNYRVICTDKSHKNSLLRKILLKVKNGIKIFEYEDIKRVPIISPIPEISKEVKQEEKKEESGINLNIINKPDLSFKKKLFAKSPFPMFAYHQKHKFNEYGYVLHSLF